MLAVPMPAPDSCMPDTMARSCVKRVRKERNNLVARPITISVTRPRMPRSRSGRLEATSEPRLAACAPRTDARHPRSCSRNNAPRVTTYNSIIHSPFSSASQLSSSKWMTLLSGATESVQLAPNNNRRVHQALICCCCFMVLAVSEMLLAAAAADVVRELNR